MAQNERTELGPFLRAVGPLFSWLRDRYILLGASFLGAVVAVISPIFWSDPGWNWIRITAGVLAALAIVADRVGDRYEQVVATLTFRESERAAEQAVDDLNVVLSEAIEAMFLEGASRRDALKALRRTVAHQAARAVGDGSRATYYTLRRESGGKRILDQALHGAVGRYDKPDRPFIENDDPDHEIWRLMDRADEEPEVKSRPDAVYGVDWDKKKYDTFYTVPVKAASVQLGLLSVNNSKAGAIGGAQRAVILVMARLMALVVAAQKGPGFLNSQAQYHRMSLAGGTVSATSQEAPNGR